ncbi:gamma-glutamyl-gamma-aminobutyrate hydrolase family protein [Candidatus Thioglobus sp. NP1]|jgi:GMP synthase-like glutamine amidotransferase|uniref:glutamine amidotransferase-related protein n=1 Tax=Candidatus Thioglobus sp. NP1 TaxID=2508687 RepID=UPI000DEDB1C2|nr:gamma-glutamyl-gamma-aminobutyrate hydrolase family protein [Candidatus Thioglobus sp. NP1]AXE62515.1 glutamine amidotransferase [Candidatus Thioglobus sp. NP1]|tara:strand:- start:474 stop:1187 length:714 start_codon:yes stop_codon:yes gene_type:complete
MKIGILLVGRASEDLVDKYGTYAEMLINLINSDEKLFEFKTFNILDGIFPLNHNDCDGWIVTGSPHGVYEEHSWIPIVSQLIKDIYDNKLPIFGVCFGHQLIAQALGGNVEKSTKGWGLGLHTYQINNKTNYMGNLSSEVTLNICHQDQVLSPPNGATVYAKSDFCENAGFYIKDKVLTMQAHPEFLVDFIKALLTARRDVTIPKQFVDPALIGLKSHPDSVQSNQFAETIRRFFLN